MRLRKRKSFIIRELLDFLRCGMRTGRKRKRKTTWTGSWRGLSLAGMKTVKKSLKKLCERKDYVSKHGSPTARNSKILFYLVKWIVITYEENGRKHQRQNTGGLVHGTSAVWGEQNLAKTFPEWKKIRSN